MDILAAKLAERGIKNIKVYDVSVTDPSYLVAEAFRCSHIVIASSTYNNGIFTNMENLLHEIAAHNLQNRKIAIMQNGSWAPVSGKLIEEILAPLKNMEYIGEKVTLKSSMKTGQNEEIDKLADAICASMMP